MRKYKVKTFWTNDMIVMASNPQEAVEQVIAPIFDNNIKKLELFPLKEVESGLSNAYAELLDGKKKSICYYSVSWSTGLRGKRQEYKELQEWLNAIRIEYMKDTSFHAYVNIPLPNDIYTRIVKENKAFKGQDKLYLMIVREYTNMDGKVPSDKKYHYNIGIGNTDIYLNIRNLPYKLDLSQIYTQVINAKIK